MTTSPARAEQRLIAKFNRVDGCDEFTFVREVRYFLDFVKQDPAFSSIIQSDITAPYSNLKGHLEEHVPFTSSGWNPIDESQRLALAYYVLEDVAEHDEIYHLYQLPSIRFAGMASKHSGNQELVDFVRDEYVKVVAEHLLEQVDACCALLNTIHRYKHQREWFGRDRLQSISAGHEGKKGERALCVDLYEYLYEQGADFTIEPGGPSGRMDLLIHQKDGESKLPIDAKYIRESDEPAKIKKAIAAGFRQVHDYCGDYQQPVGYLVLFKETSRVIEIDGEFDDAFPALRIGNRTIYFVEVDMCSYEDSNGQPQSASKRGAAEVIHLTSAELIELAQKEADKADTQEAVKAM